MLAGVAVLECSAIVGELKFFAALDCFSAVFTLAKFFEIPQIALAVWTGSMGGEFLCVLNLQYLIKVSLAVFGYVSLPPNHVVVCFFPTGTRSQRGQIANSLSQCR